MSQPTPYTPTTDFSQQESMNASGRSTVNTAALDAELANIETTLDQTLANITLLQRDDGRLKDLACELHTLSPEVLNLMGGFNLRGLWLTATVYAINDIVSNAEYTYVCKTPHTSGGAFDAQYWVQFGFSGGADAAQAAAAAQVSANNSSASAAQSGASATSAAASATSAAASAGTALSARDTATLKAGEASLSATAAANSAAVAATAVIPDPTGHSGPLVSNGATSVWLDSQMGYRNKVIGDFSVNQRGLTSVADDFYCCDRWYALTETGSVTVGQVIDPEPGAPYAWKLTQPDAVAKRIGLATIIESKNIRAYRSQAMNFSLRVKPSFTGNVRYAIIEHTGTADVVTSDVVNNWNSATFTPGNFFIAGLNIIKTGVVAPGANLYGDIDDHGIFGASLNNAILFVWSESAQIQGATLELNRPQFEPGIISTPHEWHMNERSLCEEYFQRHTGLLISGYNTAGSSIYGNWTFPTMRATPSLSSYNSSPLNANTLITTGGSPSSVSYGAIIASTGSGYIQFDLDRIAEL